MSVKYDRSGVDAGDRKSGDSEEAPDGGGGLEDDSNLDDIACEGMEETTGEDAGFLPLTVSNHPVPPPGFIFLPSPFIYLVLRQENKAF